MKKLILVALGLIGLAVAVFVFLPREGAHRSRAAEIAPAETVLFVQLPDVQRSVRRWPETALFHLWQEPEMQAFLDRPLAQMPMLVQAREMFERLARVEPREAFLAITALDGKTPKFVAGLAFSGRQADVAALVAEPWAAWKKAWPAGRLELLNRRGRKIETYCDGPHVLAGCFHGGWYFVANDLAVLEAALERCENPAGAGLASTEAYRQAAAPLPGELDAMIFAQLASVQDHLGKVLAPARPALAAPADLGRPLAWGMKFEGAQIRDTIFLAGPGTAVAPLARTTLALSAPETLLYVAFTLPERVGLPPALRSMLELVAPAVAAAEAGLARKRITWEDFGAAFGPEAGVLIDWPEQADAPSASFALVVRDAARARAFVEALTAPVAGEPDWQREEHGGMLLYRAPADPRAGAAPGLALSAQFAVLGNHAEAMRGVMARLGADGSGSIARNENYVATAGQVGEPSAAYGYLDFRGLFERAYSTLRPFLAMSLAFSQDAAQYFDGGKLPSTAAVAGHLGPSVYSQAVGEHGTLIESAGTLTFSQILAGIAVGAWTSAGPALQRIGRNEAPTGPAPLLKPAFLPPDPAKAAEISQKPTGNAETSRNRAFQP